MTKASKLMGTSDDDEEEEETVEGEKVTPAPDGGDAPEAISSDAPPRKKSKAEPLELVEYSPDELRSVDKEMLNAEITQLEGVHFLSWSDVVLNFCAEETGKAKPNLNVLAEYRKRESEFLDRARDMEHVTSQRDSAKKRYDDLRKVRLDEFMAGFSAISSKLKEMYQVGLFSSVMKAGS